MGAGIETRRSGREGSVVPGVVHDTERGPVPRRRPQVQQAIDSWRRTRSDRCDGTLQNGPAEGIVCRSGSRRRTAQGRVVTLARAGLVASVNGAGFVVGQSPDAGQPAPAGSTIALTLGRQVERIPAPVSREAAHGPRSSRTTGSKGANLQTSTRAPGVANTSGPPPALRARRDRSADRRVEVRSSGRRKAGYGRRP